MVCIVIWAERVTHRVSSNHKKRTKNRPSPSRNNLRDITTNLTRQIPSPPRERKIKSNSLTPKEIGQIQNNS